MHFSKYKQQQLKYLASLIKSNPKEILGICESMGEFYYEKVEDKIDKTTGVAKKYSDGTIKKRVINPSIKRLKILQKNIKNSILSKIIFPPNIQGGLKGKSNITNARFHKGNKYKISTDLVDFYPSISNEMVYTLFLDQKYSDHTSRWLTKLCTWKFITPQGTPTSNHIANAVFLKTDYKLIEYCISNEIKYTRYVDDLTFSSHKDFSKLIPSILEIIKESGFKINYRKTKWGNEITGIITRNNKIEAPDNIKKKADEEIILNKQHKPYFQYLNTIKKANLKKKIL